MIFFFHLLLPLTFIYLHSLELKEVEVDLLDIVVNCETKNYYSYIMIIFLDVVDINATKEGSHSTQTAKGKNG